MKENNNIQTHSDDEIDLIQLAKTLWEGRRTVVKTTIIFMLIGLFVAIFSEKEYTASCTMVPQSAEGGSKLGGSLGGLAAMAGINLGSIGGGVDIPPSLYPQIVYSLPFQKELLNTKLSIDGINEDVTYFDYYDSIYKPGLLSCIYEYSIGLPRLIIKSIRGKSSLVNDGESESFIRVSEAEKILIERLQTKLIIEFNDKEGFVYLSANMPEAKASAQLAKRVQDLLQSSVVNYKVQKARGQLEFIEKRYDEKKKESELAQARLAEFRDKNKNVSTAKAQTELEKLTAEYNLIYGVYSELAKQLETQKIQVKEDTPVFTVIEPVTIPLEKSKPRRVFIFIMWTMIGAVLGVVYVLGHGFIVDFREKW